ncbi:MULTISPECIES: DUF3825 domain-containing protein [Bacillus]|uniref:DUF3825 domain-containing protein n=1 Tax=Bacillus TaxID=1386 RepID=UPI0020224FD3|nr:DUF3825 domain-containing protein [Bacillus altitudinis]MCL7871037.1 DUF3825 domain-containing protein [Bacillus altitudinis]
MASETISELKDFAYLGNLRNRIKELKNICLEENWGENNQILFNYLNHTFKKIYSDYSSADDIERQKFISITADNEGHAVFNTGLFTKLLEPVYAFFEKNKNKEQQDWYLAGFKTESDTALNVFKQLPERAQYFNNVGDLIYDYRIDIRPNVSHILAEEENINRLPNEFQKLSPVKLSQHLTGAIEVAKKKVAANYKLAVPQYYKDSIQLLVPLSLSTTSEMPDLALAIKKENGFYQARTCLTMSMAYNNARLIVKPEVDWLQIDDSQQSVATVEADVQN